MQYLETDIPLTQFGPPEIIDIEPIQACNLRCLQCHVSYETLSHTKLNPAFLKNLKGIENRWVLLGEKYEPFAHPKIGDIVSGLSQLGAKIEVTTNGTLFTPKLEKQLEDAQWTNIVISFDGATKETFESIRRNADFDKTIEKIINFKAAVQAYQGRDVTFSINYTILRRNIQEIPLATGLWEGLGFDHIGFIAMVTRNSNEILDAENPQPVMSEVYEQLDIAARNVIKNNSRITLTSADYLNRWSKVKDDLPVNFMNSLVVSNHPETRTPFNPRPYFQNGEFPGMKVRCRSPFKYVRILYNGDVQLCFQFTIGSIYENNILDIWYGKQATEVRDIVKKNPTVCYACDYYKFCIKAEGVDYENQDNLHNESMVTQFSKPLLMQELGAFQLVGYLNGYYSFPKIMGHLDPRFFDNTDENKKIFQADTIVDLKDQIRKFFENNEPDTLESITSSIFVQVIGKYNIMAWWDGYVGIPKAYGPIKINRPGDLDTKGIFFDLSLEKLKSKITEFSNTNELPDLKPKPVEFKKYNIFFSRGDYFGIPQTLNAIDPESDNLKSLDGALTGPSLAAVKEKIDQKILAEEERHHAAQNLQIVAYKEYNIFKIGAESFAVPQAIGPFDPFAVDLKNLEGVLTADNQKELENKIDQKILAIQEEPQGSTYNLKIIAYREHNTFQLGAEFFAVPQALGAVDLRPEDLKLIEGVLTANNRIELEEKINQKILAEEKRKRAAQNLKIVTYKKHNTFQLISEFFAVPQAIGPFDPLSGDLKNLEGVLTADSQKELKNKIDQKILDEEKRQRAAQNLKIVAYKGHNTFQLGSEFFAVPQTIGPFDPLSGDLKNLEGVLTADSQKELKNKIDQKILDEEKRQRAAQNLKIVDYKGHNTFQLGSESFAVPQALGVIDLLSDDLRHIEGVLTADSPENLAIKINQKVLAEADRQRAIQNLKIVAYKDHNTFLLISEFFAVPQSHGPFDPLSDNLKQLEGVLTANNRNELENKIDQKILVEEERQRAAQNLQIVTYKGHNTFQLGSEFFAVPQAHGPFDPFAGNLKQLEGVLTASNRKELENNIDQKILAEEERQRAAQNLQIVTYKGHNTFQLISEFFAVPQALGPFDPFASDLKQLEGMLTASNRKELENNIDQKILAEEERQRAAQNLQIVTYKGHNTFQLISEFFAVPQALGPFDPLAGDLKNLKGVLTADDQKELENKIDQKILVEKERQLSAQNLQIIAYKDYNTFCLGSESFAVPQFLGPFDPLSDDLKSFEGVLIAHDLKTLKKKIDQKILSDESI